MIHPHLGVTGCSRRKRDISVPGAQGTGESLLRARLAVVAGMSFPIRRRPRVRWHSRCSRQALNRFRQARCSGVLGTYRLAQAKQHGDR